jgi:hypothetical protein
MARSRTLRWAGCATAVTAALTVSACAKLPNLAQPNATYHTGSPSASPSDHTVGSGQQVYPLTGLPAPSAADAAKPAVALLVSGTDPTGLGQADVVYEEATNPVRYIAVYQSTAASNVGPITSTEPEDRNLLPQLHPVVGYNGAVTPYMITLLDKTKITDASYGKDPSLYSNGSAGLTTSTQAIASQGGKDTAPPPLFSYRGTGAAGNTLAGAGLSQPTSATVTIPGVGTEDWAFDSHTDRWTLTSGGPSVQAANVVIQTVSYSTDVLNTKTGKSVPVIGLTTSGRAEVLSGSVSGGSGGTAASGTWSRLHGKQITDYFDSAGAPMAFSAGPTWVILVPSGTQVSTAG